MFKKVSLPISVLTMLLFSMAVYSQTPVVGAIADVEEFPSTGFCSTATITNSGAAGYGPYLQIVVPDGLTLDSSDLFGSNVGVNVVGVFPAAPGNQLVDPVTGQSVTGDEGSTFYTVQPPIGSVVSGGVDLDLVLCFTIDATAPVNVPINVEVTPVYEFGDTATGDNGPIVGSTVDFDVTPVLVEFEKSNSAPEGERPPGPDWPVSYTLNTNVAPNNTIENLVIADVLPIDFVIDVSSINVTGGVNCVVNTTNPINITCDSVTGTGSNDVVVTYSGYFSDVLNEAVCDLRTETNTATFDGEFPLATSIPQLEDTSVVQLEHISIQKSASSSNASPGQSITFTLNIQISEYATTDSLIVVDNLPDGYTFVGNETSSLGAISAAVSNDTPGVGQTELTFDLTALSGNIVGGAPNITVSYDVIVDQAYENPVGPVLASDSMLNSVVANYSLTAGASVCSDDSNATVNILPVVISKSVVNPQAFYMPGETVTYRLTLEVPSGDTNGVIFQDFLPLPVFDATTVNTTFNTDIVHSPLDTLGLTPLTITTDGASNSVTINWPNITSTVPQILSVDLSVDVVDSPFADNLSLSNLLQVTTENTSVITSTAVAPVLILVRAPDLILTKGVLTADQGAIAPLPSVLPVDGNITDVDANDSITYQITVENTGGADAYDVLITDPVSPGLATCVIDSVNDGTGTPLAYTGDLTTAISLTNPLAGNDDSPIGGGAPFSDDTALVNVTCDVAANVGYNTTYVNTASVSYAAVASGPVFPTVQDTATLTVAEPTVEKTILNVVPNVDGVDNTIAIGETIQYQVVITLPEGQGNSAELVDLLDVGLVFDSFDSITGSPDVVSSIGFPTVLANAGTLNTINGLFDFGTVNNNNTDNSTVDTITVVYTVLVTDVGSNSAGATRNNQVTFNTSTTTDQDTAPERQITEPFIQVNKAASPTTADAGDTISYTITVTNNGNSPAFDVVLEDLLADVDLDLVAGTVVVSQGAVITGNTLGETIVEVNVGDLAIGASMTVEFDATISSTVASGETVDNTATVTNYNSLPGGGRVYDDVDDSATVNIDPAVTEKIVLGATSTEQSDGINTRGDVTLADLTIGEEVTFRITTTLAEGVSPSVIITDNLPNNAAGQMDYVSANIVSVGGNLLPLTLATTPAVPALPSSVSFDFGSVTNTSLDDVVTSDDQIVIEVTGRVTDIAANQGLEELINNVIVQFNAGLNATAQATIEVVEPVLTIDKTSATTTADAGDTITYTLTVDNLLTNNTSANAFDVTLTDNIPAGFTFAGNLTTDSGLAPDSLTQAAGVIVATWANYPIGSTSVISFDVTVDNTVAPGQIIQNTAGIDWTSLPGIDVNERTSSDSDPHTITIGETGLLKVVTATSEPSTGVTVNGGEDDLTIGEEVTYRFTVTLPEGTTPNAVVFDQLPTGTNILSLVSSEIISIGANLAPANGNTVGQSGTASNTDVDVYDDRATWNFGDVLNTPDGLNNADDEIVFEVVAMVVDEAVNQGGANDVVNTASLTYTGGNLSGTALVDLVEPRLNVTKSTVPAVVLADAGDVIDFQIVINHIGASNADAFNLVLNDLLPTPGLSWIDDTAVNFSSTCGAVVDSISNPSNIEFTINQLTLAAGTCTINYKASVDLAVKPGTSYSNDVFLQYDSTPVFVAGETRRANDAASASFNIGVPSISKVVTATSLGDTGTSIGNMGTEDLAVGELVDYTITITVPEGTSNNSTLRDNLPVAASGGAMEVMSAVVTTLGANITTSLPGTPVLSDTDGDLINDQVLFDFGNIVNQPDMVVNADDQITVTITARIADNAVNSAIESLFNDALFTYGLNGFTIADSAEVELVEPNLGLDKSMGAPVGLVVPIQFILNNTGGTASAYDLTLVDVLSDSVWDLSTITPTNIPAGFVFNNVAGPGPSESTVTISSDGGASPPASSIEPNEVLVFEFTVAIRSDIPFPTSIVNTVTLTEASSMPGVDDGERDYSDIIATDTLQLSNLDATKSDALLVDNGTAGEVNPGDTLRYTIVLDNSGAGDATTVVFSDVPDANTTLVVGSVTTTVGVVTTGNTAGDVDVVVDVGTIVGNSSVTITFDVVINNPFPQAVNEISNQGLIQTNEFPPIDTDDPDTGTDDDPTDTPIGAGHDLEVTKDDGGITATAGDTVVYTINYANIGNQNSTGVVITETVPNTSVFNLSSSTAGWSCVNGDPAGTSCTFSVGNLNGGESGSVLFAIDIFDPKPSGVTEILNTVIIADDGNNGADDDSSNNTDDDDTPINAAPDLVIVKTSNGLDVVPGDSIVYDLSFQNIGNQDATGVIITEQVPANTTFNAGSSDPAWSCTDGDPAATVCIYNVGNLAAGASAQSIDFAVNVLNPLDAGVTEINNLASISDDGNNGADTDPTNNIDDEDTNVIAVPDLIVSKDDGGITVGAGDTIPYLISYQNIGNQEATGVVLTEVVPNNTTFNAGASDAWSCLPTINAGSTCTLNIGAVLGAGAGGLATFAVDVVSPKPSGVTLINNTVTISEDGNNGIEDTSNNNGSDDTPVVAAPDLTITKTSQVSTIDAGQVLIYDLAFQNIGTQDATGVVINETVPVNSTFNAANSTGGWSCADGSVATTSCTYNVGLVGAGVAVQTVQFAINIVDPLPAGVEEIFNNASIADDGNNGVDTDITNNDDDDTTVIGAAPDLLITKTDVDDLVNAGDVIVYQLTYQNIGTQDSTGVVITETVPTYTTFNAANSTPTWSCADGSLAGTLCTYAVGDVDAGDPAQMIEFVVNVLDPIPAGVDTVLNDASIADDGSNGNDADPTNNDDDEDTTIGAFPDLTITKTDNDVTSAPGGVVVYVLDYSNMGTQDSTGVIITETVPVNTTYNAASSSVGWVCLPNNLPGSICEYTVGNLNAGDSGSVNFAVEIDDPLAPGVNEIFNTVVIADDGTNGDDINPDNDTDSDETSVLLDPPVGIKVGSISSSDPGLIQWTFYWFNPNNNRDLPVFIFDPIPASTFYIPGSATCTATGSSTCNVPSYNATLNQLELDAVIAPDEGAPIDATVDMLSNEIVITFETRIIGSGVISIFNQANAYWDEDNDGDANNDGDNGQDPVVTDAPETPVIGDPTVVRTALPVPMLSLLSLLMMISLFTSVFWLHKKRTALND